MAIRLRATPIALLTAAMCPIVLHAQPAATGSGPAYPVKPIRILVGFPPGAGIDIAMRLIGPKMADVLGQQVLIDNRPGAGGNIAAELGARAPADGYTLFAAGAPAAISQNSLVAPSGTSKETVARLHDAVTRTMKFADVREKFLAQGAELLSGTPLETAGYLRAEVAKWGKVVKASGARAD